MIWYVHPETPQKRRVEQILKGLAEGKVCIVPTDTVYAFVCRLDAPRAINQIYKLKDLPDSRPLSLLCRDLTMASYYARGIPNAIFRFMKAHTPGPYTFILNANGHVDRRGTGKKREVGVRLVKHSLHSALMEQLDVPLVSSSITTQDEYTTDPEDLENLYGRQLFAVVDGGVRYHEYSTILDCTGDMVRVVRQGCGLLEGYGLDHLLEYPVGTDE